MSDRPNVLKHPYGTYLMVRPEFVLLRNDDIEARLMRIIEGWMEHQKAAWQAEYMAAVNAKRTPPPEPEEYWVTISQSQFIAQLYMFDTANLIRTIPRDENGKKNGPITYDKENRISKGTLRAHLNALITDTVILVRPQPGHEFESAQYTLNRPLIQELEDKLPKNYLAIFGGVTMIECPPVTSVEPPSYNHCNPPVTTTVTPQLQPLNPLIDYGIDYQETTSFVPPVVVDTDSLVAPGDEGQAAQQNEDKPTPTLPSYSHDEAISPITSTMPALPASPDGVITEPPVPQLSFPVVPMATRNPPTMRRIALVAPEPLTAKSEPAHVPASSLPASAGVGCEKPTTTKAPPAVPAPAAASPPPDGDIPQVVPYDRHVKIADCPPEIAARRRTWQTFYNTRRGGEALLQQGPRMQEAKDIADLVARLTDAQITACDSHVLASFPYNQPGRGFEVSASTVLARLQTARQALKAQHSWPYAAGEREREASLPVSVLAPTRHRSRYAPVVL